jgi:hypothetical protein
VVLEGEVAFHLDGEEARLGRARRSRSPIPLFAVARRPWTQGRSC